ncbi:MAG: CARDB domain-containing protein [Methanotrichaceae archaeon]
MASIHGRASNDEVTFSDFTLYIGDSIDIGNYTAQLIDIQSVRDGLALMKVSNPDSHLDEQRVLLVDSANSFDGGADDNGITITLTDIFDEQSAKIRVEYPKSLGNPRKESAEPNQKTASSQPNLMVQKSFDKMNLSVGDEVKVTVTVKNIGTDTASGIEVEDLPPISEFSYIAGYPPKIKETLDPGESDYAVYVVDAVKDGSITVPAIEVRYSDAKKNIKSNTSQPFDVVINPKSEPDIKIRLSAPVSIVNGEKGILNINIINVGKATASNIQIQSMIDPSDGLSSTDLDKTIPIIEPGGTENYSAELVGEHSGNYTIDLKASYQGGDETMLAEGMVDVNVREQEYKYLYYLVIIPIIAIAAWIFKRYREYKY